MKNNNSDLLKFALETFGFLIRVWEVIEKDEFINRIAGYSHNARTSQVVDFLKMSDFDFIQRQAGSYNVSIRIKNA